MKYCPNCQAEYDEEVIRFCTKDGTPLVEMKEPSFTDKLPSESSGGAEEEDEGAVTIIRRKPQGSQSEGEAASEPEPEIAAQPESGTLPPLESEEPEKDDPQRIVISTADDIPAEQVIRPKEITRERHPQLKRSNTPIIVLLTIIATILAMIGLFAAYWILGSWRDSTDNSNISVNENIDLNGNANTNFNLDDLNLNLNSNADENLGLNSNSNFNLSTPSPTPTPKSSETPTPSPTSTPANANTSNVNSTPTATATPTPTRTATPTPARTPTPTPANTNTTVNVGTINGRAVRLPTPTYPTSARNVRAGGRVSVAVTIDPDGNVVAARAVQGHPLLRASAEDAAKRSKFRPVSVNGKTVNATGTIVYNFVN